MNDLDLLRRYADDGTQASFEAVVSRHIDLVYTAAIRQVRSPDLAHEVAQAVFFDLAASIRKLRTDTQLGSWLLVAARRRAIDIVRRESARQRIERAAAEDRAMNAPLESWAQVEPLLDEALGSLREDDRRAIVLRFFENQPLREVAVALRCTEDTAQKRVSRALDRLREFFAARGIVTIAAALATDLSAYAVQPAPSGAAAAVIASVATRATALVAQQASRAAVLSSAKVAAIAIALAGATTYVAFLGYTLHERRREIAALTALGDRWRDELRAARAKQAADRNAAAQLSASADALISDDPAFDLRIHTALAHLTEVKRRFAADPRQQIPELRLLSFADWFSDVQEQARWETDEDWRKALASVRTRAINRSGSAFEEALRRYLIKSRGVLPAQIGELASFFEPPVEQDLLDRYELVASGKVNALPEHATVIAQKRSTAIDPDHDNLAVVGIGWSGVTGAFQESDFQVALAKAIEEPLRAYAAAHGGKHPDLQHPEELKPYFSDPERGEAYVDVMRQIAAQLPNFKEENAAGLATNAYRAAHNGVGPKAATDLVPYFHYPEDAAAYLKLVGSDHAP